MRIGFNHPKATHSPHRHDAHGGPAVAGGVVESINAVQGMFQREVRFTTYTCTVVSSAIRAPVGGREPGLD